MLPDGVLPVLLVPAVAAAAVFTSAMSRSGALAGAAVGLALTIGVGWTGFAMLATLLVLGTLVSERRGRRRDALQALCNGGPAALAALLGLGPVAVGGALAAALSDTLASELGQRLGGEPRALLLGRRLPRGADGGMTLAGTLAGAAGALLLAVAGSVAGGGWGGRAVLLVAAAGFGGNLLDSVVGLFVQPRLGRRGNDVTNLIATAIGAALALALV